MVLLTRVKWLQENEPEQVYSKTTPAIYILVSGRMIVSVVKASIYSCPMKGTRGKYRMA
jgi:hypothetical protein